MATEPNASPSSMAGLDPEEQLKQLQAVQEMQKLNSQNLADLMRQANEIHKETMERLKDLMQVERENIERVIHLQQIMEQYAEMEAVFFDKIQSKIVIVERIHDGQVQVVAKRTNP